SLGTDVEVGVDPAVGGLLDVVSLPLSSRAAATPAAIRAAMTRPAATSRPGVTATVRRSRGTAGARPGTGSRPPGGPPGRTWAACATGATGPTSLAPGAVANTVAAATWRPVESAGGTATASPCAAARNARISSPHVG